MRKVFALCIIAVLFVAFLAAALFAQSAAVYSSSAAVASVSSPPSGDKVTDAFLAQLTATIDQLQTEIAGFQIKDQSDRLEYYDLQRQLSRAKAQYYNVLASVTANQNVEVSLRQCAWVHKRQAEKFDNKFYSALSFASPHPVAGGRFNRGTY